MKFHSLRASEREKEEIVYRLADFYFFFRFIFCFCFIGGEFFKVRLWEHGINHCIGWERELLLYEVSGSMIHGRYLIRYRQYQFSYFHLGKAPKITMNSFEFSKNSRHHDK